MGGMINADRFAVMGYLVLLAIAAMALVLGAHYFSRPQVEPRGEFAPLVLFATTGMLLIVGAADLIVVFLALEIFSLSLYVLTGITGRARLERSRDEVLPAGSRVLGVLPLRRGDGLRRHGHDQHHRSWRAP